MGMSASQARLLSLEARQSNLEYQGQQINQERTILSQQCTALYNSLLSMTVPTPPSTSDYTTVQYSGTDNATKFTLGTITPKDGGSYSVEIQYAKNGSALKGGTYENVSTYNIEPTLRGYTVSEMSDYSTPVQHTYIKNNNNEVNSTKIKDGTVTDNTTIMHSVNNKEEASKFSNAKFYYYGKDGFVAASSYEDAKNAKDGDGIVYISTTISEVKKQFPEYNWNESSGENAHSDFVYDQKEDTVTYTEGGITKDNFDNGTYYKPNGEKLKFSDLEVAGTDAYGNKLYKLPENVIKYDPYGNSTSVKNPDYDSTQANKGTTVGGSVVQKFTKDVLGSAYEEALKAIANSYPEYKDEKGNPNTNAITNTFSVIFKTNSAGTQVPYIIKTADYQQKADLTSSNGQNQIETFAIEANGTYTDAKQPDGCKLTFDTSGRISSIDIPILDDNGKETGKFNTIKLEAATVTDENAYKDAYAEYEYNTYLYDQKNKEINAKTEVIQQEDRNLELKLQRLDNERTQIKTEIEAVKKVINDNIEGSYKTFSG